MSSRSFRASPPIPDEALERDENLPDLDWAVPPSGSVRSTFLAPSGPLAALAAGPPDGPRVVLVPGTSGSKEDFHFQFLELAAAGYRAESYDLAGQYESRDAGPEHLSPPRRAYDYDLFTGDMVAFLEAGATPAHLLGYSFAGVVAQLTAASRPDLIASLTLLSTPPLAGQVFRGVRWLGPLSLVSPGAVVAALMKTGILANMQGVRPGRLRFVRDRFRLTRPEAFRKSLSLMRHTPDLRMQLRAAPFPIAVAVGTRDLWPLRLHRAFARSVGASIAVYRTGHSPCETAPYQLTRDLFALFEKAERSRDRGG